MSRRGVLALLIIVFPALSPAQPTPCDRARLPFGIASDASRLRSTMGLRQLRKFVQERIANPQQSSAADFFLDAELLKQLGDDRAAHFYERAIATDEEELAYDLFYAEYLRNFRGPRNPLFFEAEEHYFAALEKLRRRRATLPVERHEETDCALYFERAGDRIDRGLVALYQEDGLPLAWRRTGRPLLFLSVTGLASATLGATKRDTSEFGSIDDARRFAAEAAFASGPQRLKRPLDRDELRGIARTPLRYDVYNRLRLRLPVVGALDVSYEYFRAPDSQIGAFTEPNVFNDVKVDIVGVAWRRAFDLYPAFDALLDLGYRRVSRVGVVEWYSDLRERVNLFEAHPAVARFLGPDKLTLWMNYVYMDIPPVEGGAVADRVRARAIRAFYVDYALYRPLLLPDFGARELRRTATRGWHFYGGYAMDDEAFGERVVHRRDTYAGTSLRGLGRFDFTLQGTLLGSDTTRDERLPGQGIQRALDGSQAIRQVRPTLVALYRIVDDEAIPDVPKTALAGLNLVVRVRADFATRGPDAFDNVRGGAELWGKLIVTGLRGTTFLVTVGYEAQWFHRLDKLVHLGRVELRMGWGTL